jgi:hypothetical protein
MRAPLALALAIGAAAFAAALPASAQKMIGGNPGPAHNYVCPNADGGPQLDCYFDAVRHLYTMCRHVKSIEIIEWGHEKSQEGVNSAKSEYCIDKQRTNITRPYQGALRESSMSKQAVEGLRDLNAFWIASMADLRWRPGETADDYLTRTVTPYVGFEEKIDVIRESVDTARARSATNVAKAPAKAAAPKAAADKK